MKIGFKKILIVIVIIVCGFWYMVKNVVSGLDGTSIKGINISLNDKDKLVQETYGNEKKELLLVNSKHGLSKDYIPEKLSIPNIPFSTEADDEEKHVAEIIVKPLEELINTAKKEGITLLGNSAYRSYKTQVSTYNNRVQSQGKKLADAYVAKPGFSEHQTGLCIDITNKDRYFVEGTKEADWVAKNCYRFGFVVRYLKDKKNVTNIEYEPWHIRYVGKEVAKYIYENKITLEEYLDR